MPDGTADTSATLESALARARELFGIRAQTSPRIRVWLFAYRALAFPLMLVGRVRWYRAVADGTEYRVACVGFERRFGSLLQNLFDDVEPLEEGPRRLLAGVGALDRIEADFVLVDVHAWLIDRFRAPDWHVIPEVVRWRGRSADLPPADPPETLRSDLRKIEKYGYTLEVAGDSADWSELFEHMVIPHANSRFGQNARIPSARALKLLEVRGRLLFVIRDGVRVAGGCVLPAGNGLLFERLGIRGSDDRLLREGALVALYVLAMRWAADNGFEEFDAGTSLPSTRDGIGRFKSKMGFAATIDPFALRTALRVKDAPAARAVLDRSPLFVETKGRLEVLGGEPGETYPADGPPHPPDAPGFSR